MNKIAQPPRNLFEVDNARYLSTEEVVRTFVATDSLWRLISSKNHIVLGARGSGKTALLRMLAHSHLSRYPITRAKKIIESRSFIGFYLPAKADWVGGLKNKMWLNANEKEAIFNWRLNLASCISLATALESCLRTYFPDLGAQMRAEESLVNGLAGAWIDVPGTGVKTIDELTRTLEKLDYDKQIQLVREKANPNQQHNLIGAQFHTELFQPVKRGIQIASPLLEIPTTATWMLCLDEAEALEEFHHRIINSYLRTNSDNLVFKVSTTPYGHKTLDTNVGAGLSVGNDFEYVYIDSDMQEKDERSNAYPTREASIFSKRAIQSGGQLRSLKLNALLGDSILLDQGPLDPEAIEEVRAGIERYGDAALKARSEKLLNQLPKFRNEVGRKVRGAILLRNAYAGISGSQEVDLYSGMRMVIRCCDGNPRRLIRVFNKLLREGDWKKSERDGKPWVRPISRRSQTEILKDFSLSVLARVQGEQYVGQELNEMLLRIGTFMSHCLHDESLTTDTISSVRMGKDTPDKLWALVKAAVGLGLIYPNVHPKTPDEMPDVDGVFRLAYVFAPHFYLLPRRGKARRLETMLMSASAAGRQSAVQSHLFGED